MDPAAIRALAAAAPAASSSGSAVSSSPPLTTCRPPTKRRSREGGAEHQRAHRIVDAGAGEVVDPPQREVGQLARPPASRARVAAEAARAAHRGQRQRLRGPSAPAGRRGGGRPAAPGAARRSSGRTRSTPRRRRRARPAPRRRAAPARARCRSRAGRSRSGSARPRCRSPRTARSRRRTGARSAPARRRGPSQPRSSAYWAGVRPKVARQNSSSSCVSARWVCSRTPRCAGQFGAVAHQFAGHRERRARRDRDPRIASGRRVVPAVDRGLRSRRGSSSWSSTTESGGSPPADSPRFIEPRVGWKRRPIRLAATDLGLEQVAARRPGTT